MRGRLLMAALSQLRFILCASGAKGSGSRHPRPRRVARGLARSPLGWDQGLGIVG
jgi:hypothetical protein